MRKWASAGHRRFSSPFASRSRQARRNAQLPTVTVAKPVVRDVVDATNSSAASKRSTRSRSAHGRGYLDQVFFTDGAMVKKGDKLFVIRPAAFPHALSQAEASSRAARSTLVFAETTFQANGSLANRARSQCPGLRRPRVRCSRPSECARRRGGRRAREAGSGLHDHPRAAERRVDRRLISPAICTSVPDGADDDRLARSDRFLFDVDERRLLPMHVRLGTAAALAGGGRGSIPVLVTIADANEPPSRASSTSGETGSQPDGYDAGARAPRKPQTESASPACRAP